MIRRQTYNLNGMSVVYFQLFSVAVCGLAMATILDPDLPPNSVTGHFPEVQIATSEYPHSSQ